MWISVKLAMRNVFANKRRSLLMGVVIFLTSFLLLAVNAMANGSGELVTKNYNNLQAADVIAIWENTKKESLQDGARLLFMQPNGFEFAKDAENKQAQERLAAFLKQHETDIKSVYQLVRRNASLVVNDSADSQFTVFGVTPEIRDYLQSTKTLPMFEGEMVGAERGAIVISQEKANEYELKLGDKVELEAQTLAGETVKRDFTVRGIYTNGAGWDNWYGFISDADARQLFQYRSTDADIVKIYLNKQNQAGDFADELDKALTAGGSQVLRAESGAQASKLYPGMGVAMKGLFNMFLLVFLIVIAIGLRSVIRMSLFERMSEFGMLRAIGFSLFKCFTIVFFEAFFLSVIALIVAIIPALVMTAVLGKVGVYIGSGPMSYLGGETLYPRLQFTDVLVSLAALLFFALVSTFNPAFSILYQNITDVLAKRLKKVKVMRNVFRSLLKKA